MNGGGDLNQSRLILSVVPPEAGKPLAEHLLSEDSTSYVATSPDRPDDQDWQARLELHRQRRPSHWRVVEADPDLTSALLTIPQHSSVLIDALGGFVACHLDDSDEIWNECCNRLIQQLAGMHQTCVIVIEETGWGVVPPRASADASAIAWVPWRTASIRRLIQPGWSCRDGPLICIPSASACHDPS